MNPQQGQGYPAQQSGQSYAPQASPGNYPGGQGANPGLPQGYGGQVAPGGNMQQMPQGQGQQAYPSGMNTQQQQPPTPGMAPPRTPQQQNGAPGQPQDPNKGPERIVKSIGGKRYMLEVVQEPVRARMCGFGDKDRRPITPPPCVRLIIIDEATNKECPAEDFETNFFILTVDLWSEDGTKEVNLVRHSATSPSISAATSSSYPPPSAAVYPYSQNTAAQVNAHTQQAAAATGMQVHVGLTPPGYGPQGYTAHHAAPYMAQPPPAGGSQPAAPAQNYSHDPSQGPAPQSYHVSPQGQPIGAAAAYGFPGQPGMPQYSMPQQMGNMLSPSHVPPMDPRSAPQGMFTRNLIGSLAVNANPLQDTAAKLGIWFILQDLSVRTEGTFRLKMQFCSVADPNRKNSLNQDSAPILASIYSAPFHVFSAKKFPGVIESTPLSKCFAMQGVKIPIRKDGPTGKAAEVDDDAGDA